jgi:hypothetical protein
VDRTGENWIACPQSSTRLPNPVHPKHFTGLGPKKGEQALLLLTGQDVTIGIAIVIFPLCFPILRLRLSWLWWFGILGSHQRRSGLAATFFSHSQQPWQLCVSLGKD